MSGLVTATANILFRKQLRSSNINRYEPLTTRLKFSERCYSHAPPKAGNALPTELQDLTSTLRSNTSWRLFCLNARLLHCDSPATGHFGVNYGQSALSASSSTGMEILLLARDVLDSNLSESGWPAGARPGWFPFSNVAGARARFHRQACCTSALFKWLIWDYVSQ